MGKAYNLKFYLAPYPGSIGTMICENCGKPIDSNTQDFRSATKSDRDEGWRYVVHHRECLSDQSGFEAEERQRAQRVDRNRSLLAACLAFKQEWGIGELDELISDLS